MRKMIAVVIVSFGMCGLFFIDEIVNSSNIPPHLIELELAAWMVVGTLFGIWSKLSEIAKLLQDRIN